MAKSILRAGKIAGIVIAAIIVVAAVLYSAGVLTFARGDQIQAPVEPSGSPDETDDARAASLAETLQEHMRAARYDEVESLCSDAIARAPGTEEALQARQSLAELYILRGNDDQSYSAVDDMIAVFADHRRIAEAVCEVGDAWRRMGKFTDAQRLYSYVTGHFADNPYSIWSQKNLCTLYAESGDTQAADAALDKLITTYAENDLLPQAICEVAEAYCNSNNPARARQLYNQIIDTYPGHTWALWSAKNLITMDIDLLDNPNDPQPQIPGEILQATDDLITNYGEQKELVWMLLLTGEEYYNRAFRKDPGGRSAEAIVEFEKASVIFAKIITQAPVDVKYTGDAHYLTAVGLGRAGRYDEAIAYHQAVVDNWLNHHLAWSSQYWIGSFQQELKKQGLLTTAEADAKSEEAFLRLFEEYPDTPMLKTARSQLAMIYFRAHRWEEAVSVYEQIIQEAPPDDKIPKSAFYLARAYERMGQTEMALQTYREFLEAWPELSSAKYAETAIWKLGGQDW